MLFDFLSEMPVPEFLQKSQTLWTIATQLWDLQAIPRPRTFEMLALNCDNELEKEKLVEFVTPEGQEERYSYANRPKRSIVEVLRDFPHSTSKLNAQLLFEIFPLIKARSFSIASCWESNRLEILVGIVEYKTMLSKRRLGLCSNWLKAMSVGDRIRGVIKKGTFRLPKNDSVAIVMVGPGTGLAPFRSMLMEREIHHETSKPCSTLFFGCRGEALDFHCK